MGKSRDLFRIRKLCSHRCNRLIVIMLALSACVTPNNYDEHTSLMHDPIPFPNWLLSIGPGPGQELQVDKAWFGESGEPDPFWPGYGSICIQIDGSLLHLDFEDLHDRVILELNGRRIRESTIFGLLHGYKRIEGLVLRSEAVETQVDEAFNVCWAIELMPGEYLAQVVVTNSSGVPKDYSWAFSLNE